jgi:hypothetical protein
MHYLGSWAIVVLILQRSSLLYRPLLIIVQQRWRLLLILVDNHKLLAVRSTWALIFPSLSLNILKFLLEKVHHSILVVLKHCHVHQSLLVLRCLKP